MILQLAGFYSVKAGALEGQIVHGCILKHLKFVLAKTNKFNKNSSYNYGVKKSHKLPERTKGVLNIIKIELKIPFFCLKDLNSVRWYEQYISEKIVVLLDKLVSKQKC